MSDDNFLFNMYNAFKKPSTPAPVSSSAEREKKASRVLGGMKAAGVTSVTVDVNGQDVSVPRTEYVKVLEDQVKQLRQSVREMENKLSRLVRSHNKVVEELRSVRNELSNKVDLR